MQLSCPLPFRERKTWWEPGRGMGGADPCQGGGVWAICSREGHRKAIVSLVGRPPTKVWRSPFETQIPLFSKGTIVTRTGSKGLAGVGGISPILTPFFTFHLLSLPDAPAERAFCSLPPPSCLHPQLSFPQSNYRLNCFPKACWSPILGLGPCLEVGSWQMWWS